MKIFLTLFLMAQAFAQDTVILTQRDAEALIQKVKTVYEPEFLQQGLKLIFKTKWDSPSANAWADRTPTEAIIEIHGGLGRVKYMTPDHFLLLLCHEIGHHLGDEPRMKGEFYWSSVEPQADYYAGKVCMKKVLAGELKTAVVPAQVQKACADIYPVESEYATCTRTALAAEFYAKRDFLTGHMGSEPEEYGLRPLSLLTPWGHRQDLAYRFSNYPSSQCRLDTFYQGALCDQDACEDGVGMRPVCWTSVERLRSR